MEVDKVAKSVAVSLLFPWGDITRTSAIRWLVACEELVDWTIFRVHVHAHAHSFFHDGIKADGSAASQPALSGAGMMATVRTKLAFLFARHFVNYPGLCLESSPHA